MESKYAFNELEARMYELWEKANAFNPDVAVVDSATKKSPAKKHFSIIMPPPNANDALHLGHALFVSIEDILIRYHRMLGEDTVWIPGTDHAGIETQFVFEKKLSKEGKSRFNFDRATLYQMIWDYVQENSDVAVSQIKKLGASADWSRFSFTLTPQIVNSVLKTFQQLHKDGLVYRDFRLVNYCTKCGTSYSELEVLHADQTVPLYYIKYFLVENPEEFITVATVRPEPIFADTHLAVNPKDTAKKHLIGKKVFNPLTHAEMTIIGDEYVDPAFGTGIVKLTPAHDPNDFEIAKKLDLPMQIAINLQGKMTPLAGEFAGLSVLEARKAIVKKLEETGHIDHVDTKYSNRVGTCYRCKRVIEPLPLPQFFIKVQDKQNNLVKKALTALDSKETTIHGAGREKILRHWLANLKDWNISRQIVWGIKIPVWYQIDGFESEITAGFLDAQKTYIQGTLLELLKTHRLTDIVSGIQTVQANTLVPYSVSISQPESGRWIAETDTFDTWFSSAQWPVVTLQNAQPNDFDRFYPTSVMETGYDILPFWVMRMMLLGIYKTGKSPFTHVYLHGLIRDTKGQKMSKSKGNVINPLEVVSTYGADALRMALVIRSTPGQDKSVGDADFKAARNLANKVWNASRFVIQTTENDQTTTAAPDDAAFEKHLTKVTKETTKLLNKLSVGMAAEFVTNEFWHWFCDDCIEKNKENRISTPVLLEGLKTFLALLHPFMPFVTEAIWQQLHAANLATKSSLLATSSWPK